MRLTWLLIGLLVGVVAGVSTVILLGVLTVKPLPKVVQRSLGPPDMAVTITEDYLNREVAARVGQGYEAGVPNLLLTRLAIDLAPENRMDFNVVFHISLPISAVDLSATIKNQIFAQDGKLVARMVGDPQLGDLTIPISFLPFDLNKSIPQAVDKVNNDIIVSELSRPFQSTTNGSDLYIDTVTTNDNSLTIFLRQK